MIDRFCLAATLLLVVGITGCANSAIQTDAAIATVPEDFSIVFGQGGGFTGLWNGFTIRANGSVLAWSGPIQNENSEVIGTLHSEQIQALWGQIKEADYFNQESRESGNMTTFMEITADSIVHRTSWIPHLEGIEEPTSPLEILYFSARALAREAGGS